MRFTVFTALTLTSLVVATPVVSDGLDVVDIGLVNSSAHWSQPELIHGSKRNLVIKKRQGTKSAVYAPASTAVASSNACDKKYIVKDGDYCYKITDLYSISLQQLYDANPSINSGCTNLAISQELCVGSGSASGNLTPAPATTPATSTGACTKTYTVKNGDICDTIDAANGVASFAKLRSLNPTINSGCTNLAIGQILCVAN